MKGAVLYLVIRKNQLYKKNIKMLIEIGIGSKRMTLKEYRRNSKIGKDFANINSKRDKYFSC